MRKILISVFLACALHASAQHKVEFGLGLNYPIPIEKHGAEESHVGVFLDLVYNHNERLNFDFSINVEGYTSVTRINGYDYVTDAASMSLLPSVNYQWNINSKAFKPYTGIGIGASLDNWGSGVFNNGMQAHMIVVPKVGMRIVRHIDFNVKYYITQRDFIRCMASVGYIF